jgi:hypothetical protein
VHAINRIAKFIGWRSEGGKSCINPRWFPINIVWREELGGRNGGLESKTGVSQGKTVPIPGNSKSMCWVAFHHSCRVGPGSQTWRHPPSPPMNTCVFPSVALRVPHPILPPHHSKHVVLDGNNPSFPAPSMSRRALAPSSGAITVVEHLTVEPRHWLRTSFHPHASSRESSGTPIRVIL